MRPRLSVLAAMTMALGLGLAGCGQDGRGQQGTVEPGAEQQQRAEGPGMTEREIRHEDAITTWTDGYCAATTELVTAFSEMPAIDPSTPEQASRTSSELLGVMIGGLDRTVGGLDQLEPAPLAEAEAVKNEAVTTFTGIRDRAVGAKQQLDAASGDEAHRAAITAVRAPLEDVGKLNLLGGFEGIPALRDAMVRAPSCQKLAAEDSSPKIDNGQSGG